MKFSERLYTGICIRIYNFFKKIPLFENSSVFITSGFLKNYRWSLFTSDATYLSGIFDTDTLFEFKKHIKPGYTVFDLGANEGYYSLIASKLVGDKGKVISFEPMPENIGLLKKHIKINNVNNVIVESKAVSDFTGSLKFSNTADKAGNTYLNSSPKFISSENTITVDTIKLDDLMQQASFTPPDFIKIDVEGAEFDVLSGADKLIKKYKPVILIATHDFHVPGVKDRCINYLTEIGYKYSKLGNHQSNGFADFIFKL